MTNLKKSKLPAILKPNNVLFAVSMVFYVVFTLFMIHERIPNFDEVNAWNISQNCGFRDMFNITRREGHFFLWYALLKPFTLNNLYFPWSMFALNWFFAFSSVIFLWKKSPFNPWLKMFITFSLATLMLSVYARCYAIGMLILFVICSLYSKRKEHPVLYPFLIILLGNTNIVACIAAFILGLLLCWEITCDLLTKRINWKKALIPLCILAAGGIFILLQMVSFKVPYYSADPDECYKTFYHEALKITDYWPKNILNFLFPMLLVGGFIFFKKNKKIYFFLLGTTALFMLIALKVYTLHTWHYMFLFLFFVAAMWMHLQENKLKTTYQKTYYALFMLLSLLWVFYCRYPWFWNGAYIPTADYIEENYSEYKGSKIFLYPVDPTIIGIVPRLKDLDIEFYSPLGTPYNSCETYIHQWDPVRINFKAVKKAVLSEPNRQHKSFIFVSTVEQWKDDLGNFLKAYKESPDGITLEEYHQTSDVKIYKIHTPEESHLIKDHH